MNDVESEIPVSSDCSNEVILKLVERLVKDAYKRGFEAGVSSKFDRRSEQPLASDIFDVRGERNEIHNTGTEHKE